MNTHSTKNLGSDNKILLLFILTVLLQLIMMTFFASLKSGFHVDEIWTYAHSNSSFKPYLYLSINSDWDKNMVDDSFFNQWVSGYEFNEYITLSEEERFKYNSVIYNVSKSVHPPLYYFFIHTLYSFFPGGINKWYGLTINFVLFISCQILLFQLGKQSLVSKWLALYGCVLWGFGTSAINNVMFIRMYVLMTFFVLLFSYFSLRILKSPKTSVFDFICLFIATLLGALSQHYFLIYAFLLANTLIAIWINQKKTIRAVTYGITVLSGVAASFALFPATWTHLFVSSRGREATSNFGSVNVIQDNNRLYLIFNFIFRELLGIKLPTSELFSNIFSILIYGAFVLLVLVFLRFCFNHRKSIIKQLNTKINTVLQSDNSLPLIALIVLLYILIVAKIAPIMGMYWDRYIFCVFPILAFLTVWGIDRFLLKFNIPPISRLKIIPIIISVLLVFNHLTNDGYYRKIYLYTGNIGKKQLSVLTNSNCILFPLSPHLVHSWANEFKNCSYAITYGGDDFDKFLIEVNQTDTEKGTILIIDSHYDQVKMLDSFSNQTIFQRPTFLFSGDFSDNQYYIYRLYPSADVEKR